MTSVKTAGADEQVSLFASPGCFVAPSLFMPFNEPQQDLPCLILPVFGSNEKCGMILLHKRARDFRSTFSHSLTCENVLGCALSCFRHYCTLAHAYLDICPQEVSVETSTTGLIQHEDVRSKPSHSCRTEKDQLQKLSDRPRPSSLA